MFYDFSSAQVEFSEFSEVLNFPSQLLGYYNKMAMITIENNGIVAGSEMYCFGHAETLTTPSDQSGIFAILLLKRASEGAAIRAGSKM